MIEKLQQFKLNEWRPVESQEIRDKVDEIIEFCNRLEEEVGRNKDMARRY